MCTRERKSLKRDTHTCTQTLYAIHYPVERNVIKYSMLSQGHSMQPCIPIFQGRTIIVFTTQHMSKHDSVKKNIHHQTDSNIQWHEVSYLRCQ